MRLLEIDSSVVSKVFLYRKLLTEPNLMLTKAVEMAHSLEAAEQQAPHLHAMPISDAWMHQQMCGKPSSQYDADADVDADVDADADAGIEMNPIPASASTSKDAACIKAMSSMLTLS